MIPQWIKEFDSLDKKNIMNFLETTADTWVDNPTLEKLVFALKLERKQNFRKNITSYKRFYMFHNSPSRYFQKRLKEKIQILRYNIDLFEKNEYRFHNGDENTMSKFFDMLNTSMPLIKSLPELYERVKKLFLMNKQYFSHKFENSVILYGLIFDEELIPNIKKSYSIKKTSLPCKKLSKENCEKNSTICTYNKECRPKGEE